MKVNDYKVFMFYKFALSIGAVNPMDDMDVKTLLSGSFLFLSQNKVLTSKKQKELEIFKDRYNRFLEYCYDKDYVKEDEYQKIDKLSTLSVPDMSKIEVPDISKELKEKGFDIESLGDIFASAFGGKK